MLVEPQTAGLSCTELASELETAGIETRPFFFPLNIQPPYADSGSFAVSSSLSSQGISLPSGNEITDQEIDRVCDTIRAIINDRQGTQ